MLLFIVSVPRSNLRSVREENLTPIALAFPLIQSWDFYLLLIELNGDVDPSTQLNALVQSNPLATS